jgi:hypothetical protein
MRRRTHRPSVHGVRGQPRQPARTRMLTRVPRVSLVGSCGAQRRYGRTPRRAACLAQTSSTRRTALWARPARAPPARRGRGAGAARARRGRGRAPVRHRVVGVVQVVQAPRGGQAIAGGRGRAEHQARRAGRAQAAPGPRVHMPQRQEQPQRRACAARRSKPGGGGAPACATAQREWAPCQRPAAAPARLRVMPDARVRPRAAGQGAGRCCGRRVARLGGAQSLAAGLTGPAEPPITACAQSLAAGLTGPAEPPITAWSHVADERRRALSTSRPWAARTHADELVDRKVELRHGHGRRQRRPLLRGRLALPARARHRLRLRPARARARAAAAAVRGGARARELRSQPPDLCFQSAHLRARGAGCLSRARERVRCSDLPQRTGAAGSDPPAQPAEWCTYTCAVHVSERTSGPVSGDGAADAPPGDSMQLRSVRSPLMPPGAATPREAADAPVAAAPRAGALGAAGGAAAGRAPLPSRRSWSRVGGGLGLAPSPRSALLSATSDGAACGSARPAPSPSSAAPDPVPERSASPPAAAAELASARGGAGAAGGAGAGGPAAGPGPGPRPSGGAWLHSTSYVSTLPSECAMTETGPAKSGWRRRKRAYCRFMPSASEPSMAAQCAGVRYSSTCARGAGVARAGRPQPGHAARRPQRAARPAVEAQPYPSGAAIVRSQ